MIKETRKKVANKVIATYVGDNLMIQSLDKHGEIDGEISIDDLFKGYLDMPINISVTKAKDI